MPVVQAHSYPQTSLPGSVFRWDWRGTIPSGGLSGSSAILQYYVMRGITACCKRSLSSPHQVLRSAACRSVSLPVGSNSLQTSGTMQTPAVHAHLSYGAPAAPLSLDQLSGRKRSLGTGSASGKRIRTVNPPASPQQQLRRQWEQEGMVDLGLGGDPVELMGSSTLRSSGALSVQPQPHSPHMGDAGSMSLQALSAPHLLLQQQQQVGGLLPMQQRGLLPHLPGLRAQHGAGSTDSEQPSCTSAAGPGTALVPRPSQQMSHVTPLEAFACEVSAPLLLAGADGQEGTSVAREHSAGSGDLMLGREGHAAASHGPDAAASGCLGQQAKQQQSHGMLLDPLGIGPAPGAQLDWASTHTHGNSGLDSNEQGSPALDFTQQLQQQQRMMPQAVPPQSLPPDSDDVMANIEAISMTIVQAPTAFGKPTNAHKVFAPPFTVRAHACG